MSDPDHIVIEPTPDDRFLVILFQDESIYLRTFATYYEALSYSLELQSDRPRSTLQDCFEKQIGGVTA